MAQVVQQCPVCARNATPNMEPLMVTPLPDYPWKVVGTDLFEKEGGHYLLTLDYFSRFPEVTKPTSTTSAAVIFALKAIFARHGIPEIVRSDNGPQYASLIWAHTGSFSCSWRYTSRRCSVMGRELEMASTSPCSSSSPLVESGARESASAENRNFPVT